MYAQHVACTGHSLMPAPPRSPQLTQHHPTASDTSVRQASLPPRRALQPVCNTSARIHLPNVGGGTPRGPSAQASAHQSIASPARQSRPCGSRPCSQRLWAPPRLTHPARMRSRHESNGRITYALVMIAAVRPTPQAI